MEPERRNPRFARQAAVTSLQSHYLDACMKYAPLILAPALMLLAACSSDPGNDAFVLTKQSRESQDWGRYLPEMYGGVMACLAANPSQPAYVTDVTPQNHGMILVRQRGADGIITECSGGSTGSPAPKVTASAPKQVRGPAFTPGNMAEPFSNCGSPQPVLTGTGRLIGWLTYFPQTCEPESALALSSWRAFGTDWNLRIVGTDVVFTRTGQVPQRYAAKSADSNDKRTSWILEPTNEEGVRTPLEIVFTAESCRDTAAKQYSYRADLTFRGQRLSGCAERSMAIF